ncbi:hypothetical protein E5676_scaffold610G00630 [Cucumis melo var. makuwa]|uniref:Uncharacterized protein n=1 Tax=Cucumis melo var. makuwa TaxID=1194695 RepID=A0A5A7UDI1_CUCMM|nr:hypothetical protein E6C27_scaffold174G00310 [Cucumis melo var. makuwa]TYK24157.1 hypothetical protein E5676_scaffold610G00630 [Cucumis melo var. makuwa]
MMFLKKLGSSNELQSSKVFLKLEFWKKACILKGASVFEGGRLLELRRLLFLERILSRPSGVKDFPSLQMKRTPIFIEFPSGLLWTWVGLPICLSGSFGYTKDQFVLGVPLGSPKTRYVPTGSQIARVRKRASSEAKVKVEES